MNSCRVGVLTSGGDCAGINSAIKWLVKTLLDVQPENVHNCRYEVVGIIDGFKGLAFVDYSQDSINQHVMILNEDIVRAWDRSGGTNLGTSRFNPFHKQNDMSDILIHTIEKLQLEYLVVIGGFGSINIAYRLAQAGIKIICIPKTIDNDIPITEYCLGFETALEVITGVVDKLRTTAGSHKRAFVVETMGRSSGWLALRGGESCGAYITLIPEYDFSSERVSELLIEGKSKGNRYEVIVAAEGAKPMGRAPFVLKNRYDETGREVLGGVGEHLSKVIHENTGLESRSLTLGHVQRGGNPCAFDRRMGRYFGIATANYIFRKEFGKMISYRNRLFTTVPINEVISGIKTVEFETMYDTERYNSIRNNNANIFMHLY